jgi:hypothetical protein
MITTSKEYYDLLYRIQDENAPSIAVLLPSTETIYDIDLNTRTIAAPEFLSVEKDHRAETIFFKVNRYFDHVDLTTTTCIIKYINAKGEGRIFAVPYYDVDTLSDENKMIIPWVIDGDVTKASGDVQYSIEFYRLNSSGRKFEYSLGTLTSVSKVLHGIDQDTEFDEQEDHLASISAEIFARIDAISKDDVYWITL